MGWKKEEDGLLQFLSTLHHSLFWATFGDWLDSIVRPKIVYIPSKMTWIICCWPVVVIEQVADCLTRVQCSSGWIGNDDTAIFCYIQSIIGSNYQYNISNSISRFLIIIPFSSAIKLLYFVNVAKNGIFRNKKMNVRFTFRVH